MQGDFEDVKMKYYSIRNIEDLVSETYIHFTKNIEPHNKSRIRRYTTYLLDKFKEDDEKYYEKMVKYRKDKGGKFQ